MSKDTLDHNSRYGGWTALHTAAHQGHLDAVRQLLGQGADPNAREEGDHTYPLHWAAAHGHLETVRALLDAGTDVHGVGDDHELDVIGWATVFRTPGEDAREVTSLLVERGARHHMFSAIALGDLDVIRTVVERDPKALDRRMSHFEERRTPLHFAMMRKRYDIVDLLIELGADLEATDQNGRTPLATAILGADLDAIRGLHAAGAKQPSGWDIDWSGARKPAPLARFTENLTALADSIKKGVPMIHVEDVGASIDWYVSIGFKEIGRFEDNGVVQFGMVSFGQAEVMLVPWGKPGQHDVSLWFYTDDVERLYQIFKAWHIDALQAALASEPVERRIDFVRDIYNPPYGGREFAIRDPNGYLLNFLQPEKP